jgi:hypothetical protein
MLSQHLASQADNERPHNAYKLVLNEKAGKVEGSPQWSFF